MAKKITEDSGSSLSPAPNDLEIESKETVTATVNGRKRKVETTVATTAAITKRTKKASAEDDAGAGAAETPRKKRATAQNVKYEDDGDEIDGAEAETAAVVKKTSKQKVVRAKKSKEPAQPLEERTVDTKLRIGAHVSVAGG